VTFLREKTMDTQTVGLSEIQGALARGERLQFLDVRTPGEFERGHAVGAQPMPLDQLNAETAASAHRSTDGNLYVICQSGARAAIACKRLGEAGITRVFSVEGGTEAWERYGLPVLRGTRSVISLERQVRIGAGLLVLLGLVLAWAFHPWFAAISAFVGAGLVLAGVTDYCGMGMLLGKMPWNR
jgi:rhodanese-related sulfurtransferase